MRACVCVFVCVCVCVYVRVSALPVCGGEIVPVLAQLKIMRKSWGSLVNEGASQEK